MPEHGDFAQIRRKPSSGGTQLHLDASDTDDVPHCNTYHKLLSSSDGLYYYEQVAGDPIKHHIMRIPLSAPFTPQEVKVLTAAEAPAYNFRSFVEAAGYLYRAENNDNRILRTLKNGSGPVETVANTAINPNDLVVVGNAIYFSDSTGIYGRNVNCDPMPCTGGQTLRSLGSFSSAQSLLYVPVSGGPIQSGFRLYRVEGTPASPGHTNFTIYYRFCSFIVVCGDIILDPGAQAASVESADAIDAIDAINAEVQTLYAGTTDWAIGNLVLANGEIFWTETDHVGSHGSLKHKGATASLAVTPQEIAADQTGIDSRLFLVNDKIMYARLGAGGGIFTLPLNASPITRDFSIEGMEITQGIQNLANEAPLIADKTTYVRAYGRQLSGPSTPNVEVQLFATKNDLPLPGSPLKPVNGVRGLTTGGSFDRARLNDGWYFLLPANWLHQGWCNSKW